MHSKMNVETIAKTSLAVMAFFLLGAAATAQSRSTAQAPRANPTYQDNGKSGTNPLYESQSSSARTTGGIGIQPKHGVPIRGVPLRGIGVSLGKVPGGGCAARTTDANGQANFGAWPVLPKGSVYTITVASVPDRATVTVKGAEGGSIVREVDRASAMNRAAAEPIRLSSDGKTPLMVTVVSAGR